MLPDAVAPDLRDLSAPDPGEHAGPVQTRRVLPLDESAAAAERARLLLVEVAQRRAAELKAEAEQFRVEHARQAALDHSESDDRTGGTHVEDDLGQTALADSEVLDRAR